MTAIRALAAIALLFGVTQSTASASFLAPDVLVAGDSHASHDHGGVDEHGNLLPHDFALLGSKWNPGPNTAQFGGNPAPGGATWSIMAAGTAIPVGDPHPGVSTSFAAILAAIPGGIDAVLNVWAAASGFTNLGQVADNGLQPGTAGATQGDIRIGAYAIDGPFSVLAHAFQPAVAGMFANGTIGGDVHFDNAELWVNDPTDTNFDPDFDAFTVMLHELGHALGLGHSADPNSVMAPAYAGARRTLSADDIAGIQAIYGPPTPNIIPEPATAGMLLLGTLGIPLLRRRRSQTPTTAA